jgi:hypothetical protein
MLHLPTMIVELLLVRACLRRQRWMEGPRSPAINRTVMCPFIEAETKHNGVVVRLLAGTLT